MIELFLDRLQAYPVLMLFFKVWLGIIAVLLVLAFFVMIIGLIAVSRIARIEQENKIEAERKVVEESVADPSQEGSDVH